MDNTDILRDLNSIDELIQMGKFEKAFSELKKYIKPLDEDYEKLTALMGRYSSLKEKANLGIIDYFGAYGQEENKIIYALTNLLRRTKKMLCFERPESDYCFSEGSKSELIDILNDNRKFIIIEINKMVAQNIQQHLSEFDQIHLSVIESVNEGKIVRMYILLKKMRTFLDGIKIDSNMYNVSSILLFKILNTKIEVQVNKNIQTEHTDSVIICCPGMTYEFP